VDADVALNELDETTREELVEEFETPDAEHSLEHRESAFKGYFKQAAQIITGNQLLSHSTDYRSRHGLHFVDRHFSS
jgi:hypothetical protein